MACVYHRSQAVPQYAHDRRDGYVWRWGRAIGGLTGFGPAENPVRWLKGERGRRSGGFDVVVPETLRGFKVISTPKPNKSRWWLRGNHSPV